MQTSPKEQVELLENFKRMLTKHDREIMDSIKLATSMHAFDVAAQLTQVLAQCKKEYQLCCDMIDTIHAARLGGSTGMKPISKDFLYKIINEVVNHFGKKEAVKELFAIFTEEYTVHSRMAATNESKPVLLLDRTKFQNDLIEALGSGPGMMGGGDFADMVAKALSKQGVKWQ